MFGLRSLLALSGRQIIRLCSSETGSQARKVYPVLTGERGVNKVILLGRVGGNIETRGTNEKPVSLFSLATSQSFKDSESGEYSQHTQWHRIAVFRPALRDILSRTLEKGDKCYITGTLTYYQTTDDQNKSVNITSIVADDVIIVAKSSKNPEN